MTETQLETLVVKLVGDGSSFSKMTKMAVQQSQQAATAIQAAAKQIEGIGNSLKGFAQSAVSALAGFGLATSLQGAFAAFSDVEREAVKFNTILEYNKRDVTATTAEYKRFTQEVLDHTTATKGEVLALLKQAETMGFTGEKAENLVKASIGLGTASDLGAQQAMHIAIALERGNVQMLRRIQALKGIKDEQELVKKAQELMNLGLKQEEALTKTASFQIEKLQRAFKGVTVEVGGLVAEAIMPFVRILTQAVEQIKVLPEETKKWITWIAAGTLAFLALGPAISTVMLSLDALGITFVFNTTVQLINVAAWLTWQATVLLAQGVMWLFNAAFVAYLALLDGTTVLLVANTAATVFWTVVSGVATAATWLWNIATTAWSAGVLVANFVTLLLTGSTWAYIGSLIATGAAYVLAYGGAAIMLAVQFALSVAMAIASAAVWLYNASLTVLNLLTSTYAAGGAAAVAASVAWAGALLVVKAAVWLLNAALTVKNVLLAGIPILIGAVVVALVALALVATACSGGVFLLVAALGALVTTIIIVGGPLIVLGAAMVALVGTSLALWDVLSNVPELAGPLQQIGMIFGEWYTVIKDVIRAAQVDLPLAWLLMQAGLLLALAQLRQLWPPLWEFIKAGFSAVWEFASNTFVTKFKEAMIDVALAVGNNSVFKKVFGDVDLSGLKAWRAELERGQALEEQLAKRRLALAAAQFQFGEDSPEVKEAKKNVQVLEQVLGLKEAQKAHEAGLKAGAGFNKGMAHEIGRLDGVLKNSAEALAHINAYRDKLNEQRIDSGKAGAAEGGQPAVIGGVGPPPLVQGGGQPVPQQGPTFAQMAQAVAQLFIIAANTAAKGPAAPIINV